MGRIWKVRGLARRLTREARARVGKWGKEMYRRESDRCVARSPRGIPGGVRAGRRRVGGTGPGQDLAEVRRGNLREISGEP